MKIHHITDEWDYTLSVEKDDAYHRLTLSILRQPDRVPGYNLGGIQVPGYNWGGIRVRSSVGVAICRSDANKNISEIWLRGVDSKRGIAYASGLLFNKHYAAIKQLSRVYNALRHYERELLQ